MTESVAPYGLRIETLSGVIHPYPTEAEAMKLVATVNAFLTVGSSLKVWQRGANLPACLIFIDCV